MLLVHYISTAYKKALDESEDATEEFRKLDSTSSDEQQRTWAAQAEMAQMGRLEDISKMDVYNSALEDGGSIPLHLPTCLIPRL